MTATLRILTDCDAHTATAAAVGIETAVVVGEAMTTTVIVTAQCRLRDMGASTVAATAAAGRLQLVEAGRSLLRAESSAREAVGQCTGLMRWYGLCLYQ